jgi:ABC-type transport system involved in multi-copper enzyme maturation permease subunit
MKYFYLAGFVLSNIGILLTDFFFSEWILGGLLIVVEMNFVVLHTFALFYEAVITDSAMNRCIAACFCAQALKLLVTQGPARRSLRF